MSIEPGDYVEVITDKGKLRGILLPKRKYADEDIVVIKLDNGYNVGVIPKEVRLIKKGVRRGRKRREIRRRDGLPKISIIGTGGTIASYVDYSTGAVHPALSSEDFVFAVPEIEELCNVRASLLFNILSENMEPRYWVEIARKIRDEAKYAEGIVIPHGTDTMSYTSSALAFMFEKLSIPVVLVGSQRSSDRPSSDAYLNLLSAVKVAKSDIGEVVVVMHATSNDDVCHIHRGTRIRKMHTSRRDAFKSINSRPLGEVGEYVKFYGEYKKRDDETVLRDRMDDKVTLIYFYPGMRSEHLEALLNGMHGAIIMGTGLGHISSNLIPVIRGAIRDGIIVGMTSQCIYGSVNLNVYSTGRELKNAGVIPLGDMLPEVAYTKLMWLLGNYEVEEVKRLMRVNLRGEIADRRFLE